ncbi:YgfZ/GcvT domain-containing protein [Arenimonas sp.]|uniref:CAF17-like 4Fe-4S cluster assembly/insertion protein YgfZ n=1 Tax=Arenimonas sp. TaxID=1872635 RepID=UPI0039E5EFFE
MPNKIDNGLTGLAMLDGFTVLEVEGADAGAFLQAQCMNDVAALATGQWQWNGWLNPKGRVIALFALLRTDERRYLLVLPDYPANELKSQFQRYVFRSKLGLTGETPWSVAGSFGPVAAAEGEWRLPMASGDLPRELRLVPAGTALPPASDAWNAAWRAADIAAGFPRLGVEQRESWTPQMLSLGRFSAYSLKKGCYPGQEIVARTHYLGQAKRGLIRISGSDLAAGRPLTNEPGGMAIGEIVCATADGEQALAVASLDKSEAALWSGELPLQRLALPSAEPA